LLRAGEESEREARALLVEAAGRVEASERVGLPTPAVSVAPPVHRRTAARESS
jgi:hypothetical protein